MKSENKNSREDIILIKNYFFENYKPGSATDTDIIFMSTNEIYNAFFTLYPSKAFKREEIASWLIEGGFTFIDMGTMKFEWILKL